MFQPILKRKFEYFTNYFTSAFKSVEENRNRSFVQSIVLYGQDTLAQYYIALDIARQLNCTKNTPQNSQPDCTCINCNWIKNNQHPAVLTITKNDNKPSDDTSTKVISIKQALMVNNSLINSSEYYRVFIFCDSIIGTPSEHEKERFEQYKELDFKFPQENWFPKPLNREILIEASANALLKSIEEPPEKTLFIFLTKDKEDIIETIISRSQCFYIPSFCEEKYETEIIEKALADYPTIKKADVLKIVSELIESYTEKSLDLGYVLDSMEFYLAQMMKRNLNNKILVQKIKKDLVKIQYSKKQSKSYIKQQLILEDLFFNLI